MRPLIPRRCRPAPTTAVARALLEGVLEGQPGAHVVESDRL